MDPTTLSLTGFWRGSYASNSTWVGTASAGSSGTSPDHDMVSGNVGLAGTAQNGFTPFDGNGTSIWLTGSSSPAVMQWSDLIGSNANFYMHVVGLFRTAAATTGQINDPAFISDNGGSIGISYSTDGIRAWFYDGVGFQTTPAVAMATSVYTIIQVWYDGTNLNLRVNNGTTASVAAANATSGFAANSVRIGGNFDNPGPGPLAFLDGSILEVATATGTGRSNVGTASARFDMGLYAQDRYALSLGFVPPLSLFQVPASLERAERRRTHASRQYAFQSRSMVTAAPTFFQSHHMDRVERRQVERGGIAAARMQAVSALGPSPLPVITTTFSQNLDVFPDKIEGADRRRSNASGIPSTFAPNALPIPVDTTTFAHGRATYPDRLLRAGYPAYQQDSSELPPLQQATSFTMQTGLVSAPDRLPRVPGRQDWSSISSQPERTLPLADVEFPERVPRPVAHPARPGHVSFAPQPERTSPLEDTRYPERVARPSFGAAQQPVTAIFAPQPERAAPLESTSYPDRVPRPAIAVAQQPAFATITQPIPVDTTAFAHERARFPDRIERPTFHARMHDHCELPPYIQVTPFVMTSGLVTIPDRAPRVRAGMDAYALPPQPERTAPIESTSYPDRVPRPWFAPSQNAATYLPLQPERTAPLEWAEYPSRVVRPTFGIAEQQAITSIPPQPERTSTLADVRYQDRAPRPTFRVDHQLHVTSIAPQPEQTIAMASVAYPDRVPRPTMATAQQLASTAISPLPLPTAALTQIQVGFASYPDRVSRPVFAPSAQQASALWPLPIPVDTTALAYARAAYPDRLSRASTHATGSWRTQDPAPVATTPALAAVSYPDRVVRPIAAQPFWSSFATQPERTSPIASVTYPDQVARTSQRLGSYALAPQPERTAAIVLTIAPDAVARPAARVTSQFVDAGSRQDTHLPAVYADRAPRLLYAQQPTTSFVRVAPPSPPPTYAEAIWPQPYVSRQRRDLLTDAFTWSQVRASYITVAFNGEGFARVMSVEAVATGIASESFARTSTVEAEAVVLSTMAYARILEDE